MNIKFDFSLFIAQSIKTIRLFGLLLCIFFVSRLILLLRFGNFSEFQNIKSDVLDSFWVGARFDTLIISFGLLPIILINWLSGISNIKTQKIIQYFSVFYGMLAVFIFTLGLMIDGQFYTYFQTHLNIIVVGLWEDDTKNILRSVWSDHPIIILSTIWLFTVISGFFIIKKAFLSNKKYLFLEKRTNNLWKKIAFFLVFHLLYFVGLRGSIGEFTLRVDHSTVSENAFLNYLTTNGFFSLKEALEEGATPVFTKQNAIQIWQSYGFNSKQEAEKAFFGDSLVAKKSTDLYQTTPQNDFLAQNPPNVVFVMMESMGKHYFDLNSPTLNTLGELEKHLPDLFVFENFTSNQNYTIPSLTELMINIPIHNITQTSHRFKPFDASVALPFAKAGYETGYFTSGEVGWQYLHQFLPAQNFQRLVGNATLKKQNKDVQSSDWGVFDEHLFDFTFQELQKNQQKKDKKPQFYFLLSTTNHTPFTQPNNYKKLPINFSDSLKQNFMCDLPLAEGSFGSYQYASDCLGKFLTKIKSSNLAQNTIIVAVGDHNNLIVFPYKNEDLMRKRGVAMMMYVPEKYQQNTNKNISKNKDSTNNINQNFTKRFGSHKDIFPTIFNLSLSKAKFMSLGNNLFDTTKNDNDFFAINTNETIFSYIGAVNKKDYFNWDRNSNNQYQLKKINNSPANPALSALEKRKQGYLALLHYYFNEKF